MRKFIVIVLVAAGMIRVSVAKTGEESLILPESEGEQGVAVNGLSVQEIPVIGAVSDDRGEAIPGVTVVVRGTTLGTTTDINGEFRIAVPSDTCVLQFSYIGYQKQDVTVGSRRIITVVMEEDVTELGEVTAVAFGIQKKASVIASVETVKVKDLKIPATNLTSAFAGKIPGIISYQTTGEPGADNAQFFVRGVTTFGYNVSPLILIDGFEATTDDLARMQPDDIESFSILKDASATALYGARGANGIILVNTKSGMEGSVKINARVDVNVSQPTRMIKMVDGVDYMRLYNEAYTTRSSTTADFYDPQKIMGTERGDSPMLYPNIDWYEQLFNQHTYNTKANLNVSGGGKAATYYVAGGFDHETGLLKVDQRNNFNNNININRVHLRSNVIFKMTSTTTLDTRIHGRFERFNGPYTSASDIFKMVMNANPVDYPAVWTPDTDNLYTTHTLFGSMPQAPSNPYAEMVRGYEDRDESTMTIQATLTQDLDKFVKGLKMHLRGSANVWSYYSAKRRYNPYYYALRSSDPLTGEYTLYCTNPTNPSALLGNVEPSRNSSGHYYYEVRLNWDRQFGKHTLGIMTVGMMEEYVLTAGSSTSVFETLPERNVGNSGRIAYDYDQRYFAEFNYGYNGSEKFSKKHRFGFFPSIGAGWLISNERFWEDMKNTISNLKLKITYGLVGNDAIAGRAGRFYYLSDIAIGSGGSFTWGKNYNNTYGGYSISRYANEDIGWEVANKLNVGLEVSLMPNEALKFQIDVFHDIRDRVYMARNSLPASAGFDAAISGNIGKVKSQGLETSIDLQHYFNNDFWMTGRANFTYAANEYLELDEVNYPDRYLSRKGHNINQQWGYVAERLFVDQAEIDNLPRQGFGTYIPGDIKYTDINGDGIIDSDDQIPMGYPTVPEIQYGFGLSTGYKDFDFSFFFQGNARVSFFIDAGGIAPFTNRRNALQIVADDYWKETDPDVYAFWPRLSAAPTANNTQQSSWWLRDGKFLRLKTIEAGYNLPEVKKLGMKNTRVYLSAENLFVISAFKMWDPEMGANGLAYPINRRFNVGLQINF
ncbi:MAG: TonB-dependent receptor [Tannerella sp.]|jgi:TonB-linked SusC/RagA family outer membrane protein|nr:TonB-dependent receptor [Tannerella sp.]